jgi:hypothetical protein
MGRFEANLPEVLVPEGEICVNVRIPNHPDYVKLFVRAMRMLEVNRMYQRDEDHSAAIVCEQWRTRTLTPLIEDLANGNGCPEDTAEYDCIEYPAFASFIEYVPLSPFTAGAEVPPNYLTYPWWKWSKLDTALPDWIDNPIADAIESLTQYQPNDAITWLGGLPYWGIGEIIDNSFPFPYIKIHVTGKGSIRMNFLSFPLGGRIMTEVDEMPNILDILTSSFLDPDSRVIDTDRDFTTFPMEQWPVIGVKMDIEEEGDHVVYCMVLPKVEAGVDFFGFGGGLRSVELCNGLRPVNIPEPPPPPLLEGVEELRPEFQFTAECGLEYRLRDQENNIVQDWQAVAGWDENFAACVTGEIEMVTQAEITEAVVDAAEIISSRFLSGVAGNVEGGITINPDGSIVVGGAGDNPATEIDEAAAAKAGGVINIRLGFNQIWSFLNTWYLASVSAEESQTRLKNLYKWLSDDDCDTFVSFYYIARDAAAVVPGSWASTLDPYLFCRGLNKQVLNLWIYNILTGTQQEHSLNLVYAIAQEQIDDWYNSGLDTLSTDYQAYSCTPIKSYEFTLQIGVTLNDPNIWKKNHRYEVIAQGHMVDSADGDIQDAWYRKTTSGLPVFSNGDFNIQIGGAVKIDPLSFEVPYDGTNHKYIHTVDMGSSDASPQWTWSRNAGMAAGTTTSPSSGLLVKIRDLGEIGI